MAFFRIINKISSFLYFFIRFGNFKLAFLFAHYHVSFQTASTVKRSGSDLEFIQTGNRIPLQNAYVYKQGLKWLIAVLNNQNIKVASEPSAKGVVLKIGAVSVNAFSLSNIFTAYEIYLEKLYDFSTPNSNNVVVDIGMNVGYATLFFASSVKTSHVYSYEPFPETYNEAINNIDLNAHLKSKITPHNYGISDRSEEIEVPMMESGSAIASTSNIFVEHNRVVSDKKIKVKVKNIIEVLNEITNKHPQQKLFIKVDCEGEEYGIMDALNNDIVLKSIAGFFIEWHIKGPEPIINILNSNDFTSLHIPREGVDSGMIYAFK